MGSNPTSSVGFEWVEEEFCEAIASVRLIRRQVFCAGLRRYRTTAEVGLGVWLSPVERSVRVGEVPGSNPGTPIRKQKDVPPV